VRLEGDLSISEQLLRIEASPDAGLPTFRFGGRAARGAQHTVVTGDDAPRRVRFMTEDSGMSEARDTIRATTFKSAVPKQAARDISKAVEFYEQKLGFARTFVLEDYAGIARGPVEIHLWRCADRYIAENTACRVNIEGIEALFDEYRLKGVIHPNGALETKPWGVREFTVLDLDGNGITFCEPA
jgi:catechol 2,3-dioxygenase-like lactoylglutathione lyase family enzyme